MKTADKAIIDTMAAPRSILGRIQRELFGFDMATTNLPKNRKLEEKEAEKTQELTCPTINVWYLKRLGLEKKLGIPSK